MNWEFLLGLLLPAYGAGYIWLIKLARTDRVLYTAIETQLKYWLVVIAGMLVLLTPMIWFGVIGDTPFKRDAMRVAGALFFFCLATAQSFSFFRDITKLPALEEQPRSTGRNR